MAITNIFGTLGRSTNYTNDATGLTNFQNEWLTAADNQGITINGSSTATFNNTGTADLSLLNYSTNPDLNLSNLSLTRTGQAGNDTFGDIAGIGVADSYDGWWNDTRKVRAEINYNPNNGESQVLTFTWGPNVSVQSALIDLSLFAPKSAEKFGDEVGFLQAFKDGQLVDITATRVGGGLSSSIDNSGIGVKFRADDGVNGDFKFQISNADFDELRFTARPYDNPVSPQPIFNGIITDSSDYLVQKIDYTGTVNQSVIQFSNPQFTVREDGTPILAVTVVRSGGLEGPASATINLTDGTAIAPDDYNNTPITVNFADGQTSQVITVPVVNDGITEPTETVNLSLVNPSPGAVIGPQGNAVLNIVDPPTLEFSNPEYVVNEDGTPLLQVKVIRSGDTSGAVSATINLSDGTATTPADYNNTPITVNFAPGETEQLVNVPIVDDTLVEPLPPETVNLALVNPTGGAIIGTQDTAILNILDNDVPPPAKPLVFVAALDPTAGEPGRPDNSGDGIFQFARTGGDINQPLTIRYTISGTATPGTDYGALSGTVTIAAGSSVSDNVIITPASDGINEPVETVTVKVAEDLPYQVGSADTATVRVLDNNPLTGTPANPLRVLRYNSSGVFQQSYNSIFDAENAAVANDIIVAQAGFYAEPNTIEIDKPLTIRGANAGVSPGSGSTVPPTVVFTGSNIPVFTVLPGVSNVTIEGLTIQLGGDNSNAIRAQGPNINNLVIRQNVFNGQGPFNGGVMFLDSGGTGGSASVIDNLIRDVSTISGSTTSGLQAFRQNSIRVTDNVIANLTGPGVAAEGIVDPNSVINSNRLSNIGEQGIQLAGGSATIENNDITNVNLGRDRIPNSGDEEIDRGGIRLRNAPPGGLPLATVNVRSNVITNSFNGIAVRDGDIINGSAVLINNNNLIGNLNAGFYHGGSGTTINATNNWWDDPTGPVVGGTGRNAISGPGANLVSFNPFATTPF